MVQVGAFSELANARQSVQRLASLGYEAFVSEYRADARTLYRVRVGGFASREEAERVQDALSAHRFVPKVVQAE
jgi:cell division septation protein DedD